MTRQVSKKIVPKTLFISTGSFLNVVVALSGEKVITEYFPLFDCVAWGHIIEENTYTPKH
jgi:hypothetical protein